MGTLQMSADEDAGLEMDDLNVGMFLRDKTDSAPRLI
jgi:hypothetical protein